MYNFKKLSYLLLVSIFFFACSQKEEKKLEPKRTVIAGVVKNFSDDASVITVNFCNPLSDKREFAQDLTETNGYFHVEHDYVFAQNLTIRFASYGFINLFVHPGDSIFLTIDVNEIPHNWNNVVCFSGDNAELNKELFLFTSHFYHLLNQKRIELDETSPETLLASLKRTFEQVQDSINAYSERENMSDFLKNWAYMDRKFIITNYLINYYVKNRDKETTWDVFTDSIFDFFNENNFQTMYFPYHLDICMWTLAYSDVEISRLLSEKEYIPAIRLLIERLQKKAPEGVVRDVMLFNFLKYPINKIPELYDSIPEIKNFFSQDFFNIELKRRIEKIGQTQTLSETESQLREVIYLENNEIEKLSNVKLLNYLADKYKGKLLYIDVWATWCGPCLKEFDEHTHNLHTHFENKEVVFINLCLASHLDTWKPTIEKYAIGGENYFLASNASNLFKGEYNLRGYPSYLIVDKNKEIHYDVPRPSQLEEVIQKIELCLK
jgi:thiol-disulfide isomerase/thioredoxin